MLIRVKVFPKSKKEEIIVRPGGQGVASLELRIREKPLQGAANQAVVSILAGHFKVPPGKIRIIKGYKQRSKIVEVGE